MKNKLLNYINSNNLFTKDNKILVAISGGLDSVVLTNLLYLNNFSISLAHCNFNLRGKESDKDEVFVKILAKKFNLKLHTKSFDTEHFAKEKSLSIEEAARILRYNWFEQIRKENDLDYIVTAHHLNDKIETFFINITAGTGIRGIRSIKAKNNKIIRPLLFAKRNDIETWASSNKIEYRTDKSNFNTKFTRNKFRHDILPIFKDVNPAFEDTMSKNFHIFSNIEKIYNHFIKNSIDEIITYKNNLVYIDLKKLLNKIVPETILFEIIKDYGFNFSQTSDILKLNKNLQKGKIFLSKKYKLIKDGDFLIIKENSIIIESVKIEKHQKTCNYPTPLHIDIQAINNDFKFNKDKKIAYFDADKITFPLIIRTKNDGDIFHPFGMKGKKLISDFYTDLKLNTFEKEDTYLLLSGKNIIWVIGKRTDDRYKVTKYTKNILIIKLL